MVGSDLGEYISVFITEDRKLLSPPPGTEGGDRVSPFETLTSAQGHSNHLYREAFSDPLELAIRLKHCRGEDTDDLAHFPLTYFSLNVSVKRETLDNTTDVDLKALCREGVNKIKQPP